jgi:glycosyltransferase involved in cell wall biosynthesis
MIDVIIPTLKAQSEIAPLVKEIQETAGTEVRVYATCQQVSASANRNIGLNWAQSDVVIMVDDDIFSFTPKWALLLARTLLLKKNRVMVSPQLLKPDGSFGFLMGSTAQKLHGISVATGYLPTACIAIRRNELRFDENFIGSGFEDNDYCAQLRLIQPNAKFIIDHNVHAIHKNERKNQHGKYWTANKAYFEQKWKAYQ